MLGASTTRIRRKGATRQLPSSHAGLAGDLAACLASGEDACALLGWACPSGLGGPGKWALLLSSFLFILSINLFAPL